MRKKMMGGGMMQRPMYKKGGVATEAKKKQFKANKAGQKVTNKKVIKKVKDIVTLKSFHDLAEKRARKFGPNAKGTNEPIRTKKAMGGSLKPVPADNKGLKKLLTKVRNKMGFMKKGGVVSDTKKKQFKANQAGQKATNKKAMKVAKTIGKIVIPGAAAADVVVKLTRKFKGDK